MAGRIAYQGNIVTQGLVVNLDAGIKGSYPGIGTLWSDISGNAINFNISSSSYTFPSFGLNGTSSYFVNPGTNILFPQSSFTAEWFIKPSAGTDGMILWVNELQIRLTPTLVARRWYNNNTTAIPNNETFGTDYSNQWIQLVWQVGSLVDNVFVNGSQVGINRNTTITTPTITGFGGSSNINYIGRDESSAYISGSLGVFHFYNKVLSQSEILQNFNALRSRYGI